MLYYLIFKQDESKDMPAIKYSFNANNEDDVWKFLLTNIDEYFEDEMIFFYKDLVDNDCTKESSDDMTRKELKLLKKVEVSEFKNYMEGFNEDDSPDSYFLLSEESKEYKMLLKMKLLKKNKSDPIEVE